MNLKEALGKVTDPEVRAFFENMISNQNSYITKLETQLNEQAQQPAAAKAVVSTDITQEFIRKKMREEVIKDATAAIVASVGQEVFNAVKPDFDSFLEKNMKLENTKVEYAVDAFNLVMGRCMANKDHTIHTVLGKTAVPSGTPTPQIVTNGQQVAQVQNIVGNQPPVMSNTDVNAGQGLPGTQGVPVKDTKDAFKRFNEKLRMGGGNKFQ